MMNKNATIKIVFGMIIFLFSVALAYFTATYLRNTEAFDYWGALMIFGGVYIMIGMLVSHVYSISLGFLFASDVVILHLLGENFGDISNIGKAMLVGLILLLLYMIAWWKFADPVVIENQAPTNLPPMTPPPPAAPIS
jgi:hypothetical protein